MRKRRTRYQWLFTRGSAGPVSDVLDSTNFRDFPTLNPGTTGNTAIAIVPVLEDTSSDEQTTGLPLGVYQNNEYVIKRIVGKAFVNVAQVAGSQKGAIVAGLGFFVARAEDSSENPAPGEEDFPIGFRGNAFDAKVNDYGVLNNTTMREPWIWRRTWVLSNQLTTAANEVTSFPKTNVEYGSVQDGPHIDAKVARRVRHDERLFACFQVSPYPVAHSFTADANDVVIHCAFEVRVLGAMRKQKGRSAF